MTPHGLWLLLDEAEHFLAFQNFPYWPELGVDLHVDSISHPKYPLVSRPSA